MSKEELERIKKEFASQLKPLLDSVVHKVRNQKESKIFRQNLLELQVRAQKVRQLYGYMAQHLDVLGVELATVAEQGVKYFFDIAFFILVLLKSQGIFLQILSFCILLQMVMIFI